MSCKNCGHSKTIHAKIDLYCDYGLTKDGKVVERCSCMRYEN